MASFSRETAKERAPIKNKGIIRDFSTIKKKSNKKKGAARAAPFFTRYFDYITVACHVKLEKSIDSHRYIT